MVMRRTERPLSRARRACGQAEPAARAAVQRRRRVLRPGHDRDGARGRRPHGRRARAGARPGRRCCGRAPGGQRPRIARRWRAGPRRGRGGAGGGRARPKLYQGLQFPRRAADGRRLAARGAAGAAARVLPRARGLPHGHPGRRAAPQCGMRAGRVAGSGALRRAGASCVLHVSAAPCRPASAPFATVSWRIPPDSGL